MIQCYIDSSVNKLFANITKFPKQLLFACHCLVTTVKYWWHDNLDNCYQIIHNSAFQAVCSQSGRNYSMESALWYGYRPHNFLICSTHSQWMNNGWEADKLFISLFLLCMQHFMIMCSKMNYFYCSVSWFAILGLKHLRGKLQKNFNRIIKTNLGMSWSCPPSKV